MQSFVCSRIDGNNSLHYGLPNNQLQRLQRIQNAAARVLTFRKKFEHITPVLKELHWLPFKYRVKFKIFEWSWPIIFIQFIGIQESNGI